MAVQWHITVNVPNRDWGKAEGLKTLCGVESSFIIRFQFINYFMKAGMVKETDVCEKCLEIFRQQDNRS
jgi:hypothetical protein